jgi:hypothetical protein
MFQKITALIVTMIATTAAKASASLREIARLLNDTVAP